MELLFSFLSKLVYKCAYISNLPLQDPVLNFWVSNFYCVLFGVFLDDLAAYQSTLAIPPSVRTSMQMLGSDVHEKCRISNARIYVEQAIGRIKWYRILSNE